ncbi:hypothetical protein EON67_05160 [archaeon]|nr:MAG: hypothetical protein EON67_05160 [archaeon]
MALRPQVLSGYRGLLRAIGTVFRGDEIALAHCRRTARAAVMSNATEADAAKLAGMVKELGEATEFLTMNVAQAKLNDAGRYGTCRRARTHTLARVAVHADGIIIWRPCTARPAHIARCRATSGGQACRKVKWQHTGSNTRGGGDERQA